MSPGILTAELLSGASPNYHGLDVIVCGSTQGTSAPPARARPPDPRLGFRPAGQRRPPPHLLRNPRLPLPRRSAPTSWPLLAVDPLGLRANYHSPPDRPPGRALSA